MTRNDDKIKDWRSTGRKRARAVLQKLVQEGERDYCCAVCKWTPSEQSRSDSLDVNHKNGDYKDNDPSNLEYLCRTHHYEYDRKTRLEKEKTGELDDYGYGEYY